MNRTTSVVTLILAAAAMGGAMQGLASRAHAAPAPEVEYVYDVMVRRHYEPLALLSRLGGARESGAQRLQHSFDFVNALADYHETLRWIGITLSLATEMPFDFCCDNLLAHLGELKAQHLREGFGLGTFRGLCQGCPSIGVTVA